MEITEITRRDIVENVDWEQYSWHGRLPEIDFLNRLYTLENLPSTDSRFENAQSDIWQHRINNDDWENDWIFYDDRFRLNDYQDSSYFLNFLCETLHPIVRHFDEVQKILEIYNKYLMLDGCKLLPQEYISSRPIFQYIPCEKSSIIPASLKLEYQIDELIRVVAITFANEGDTDIVAILVDSDPYIELNNKSQEKILKLEVPLYIYGKFKERSNIGDYESKIHVVVKDIVNRTFNENVNGVTITPKLESKPEWRKDAWQWLFGESGKINNQGRVRSDNIASRKCDGLLFRSPPEINLYKALQTQEITFAPLPVFVRGGCNRKRIEPDFVIVREGVFMIVEVDGDTFHTESPAKAHERTEMLHGEGVYVERVQAKDCMTEEKAIACAEKILQRLKQIKRSR
ncbi:MULTISPECIES: hypothetical protein [Arthrospira]|jgi:hypothetical protein|uniref:AbiJ-NTD3 domain-containing protein n=1 Tax=Limnospira platensis NIES-46 TaxID=1236695 RepID=A0A5M3T6C5_LIMPL|nr:hypothetical protein [Arthrospira platensis]AMW27613.1 hypothetical protein AP285_06150 [Arthrospira platensis YZ]KDR57769.1 hypothetical protein APPUASWS_008900 [Arthrospira platensis str. Paraca]MBD2668884.1 hypothetical protein [Arthrospira platensis FACHB-439]MBD2709321.1 hypothetical protein [Arthrospira platensis FACHB-835]MDF2209940.1 hypothetical protein [Arthrospira platensis NCB002]MDT9182594.1 hypothetical protein [Limnospira sp. PMC 289.06]MDT9294736.1 hypothetical protein [Ar